MGQKKLIRFNAIKTFPNVLEYPENMPGKWNGHFKNTNPVVLELACGRGEYTVGLATLFADSNFIGVDIKPFFLLLQTSFISTGSSISQLFLHFITC